MAVRAHRPRARPAPRSVPIAGMGYLLVVLGPNAESSARSRFCTGRNDQGRTMRFGEQDIDAITFAIGRLEAALAMRTVAEHRLPVLEIMIEKLKARRQKIIAELKPRMH